MRRTITVVLALCMLLVLPNGVWLFRSTARVTNETDNAIFYVIATGKSSVVDLGTLEPGKSAFVVLPVTGEASLVILYASKETSRTACQTYVEGAMYHVEVLLTDPEAVCRTHLPILDDLLVRHFF